jgi:hypothetical protein
MIPNPKYGKALPHSEVNIGHCLESVSQVQSIRLIFKLKQDEVQNEMQFEAPGRDEESIQSCLFTGK